MLFKIIFVILDIYLLLLCIDVLFNTYIQTGICKKFFHDIMHECVPLNWKNNTEGSINNCRYCNKRIIKLKHYWKRY